MSDKLLLILVVMAILAFVLVFIQRKAKLKLETENQRRSDLMKTQETQMRQDAVLKELSVLGELFLDKSLSSSELETKSRSSFSIIESNNYDGTFTDLINDTKQYVASEIEDKRLSESK
jgi:hypothetical protein